MNPQDYDEDGNDIVPCPICLSAHCPSKEGGKCPEEDDFAKSMTNPMPHQDKIEEKLKEFDLKISQARPFTFGQEYKDADFDLLREYFRTALLSLYQQGVEDTNRRWITGEVHLDGSLKDHTNDHEQSDFHPDKEVCSECKPTL